MSRAERAMSFGAIAADYDRLRPAPPEEAVDWLLPWHRRLVIDLAAGTGLLTRTLAGKAGQVVAVEPDERMAAVLHARSPGARVLQGTGEAIPMADASADAVLVSSAWHWLDPERAVSEIARVLRDGGRLGLIWTSRDHQVGWVRELSQLGRTDEVAADANRAGRDPAGRRQIILPEPRLFINIDTQTFSFTRTMTVSDLLGLLATYSGVITASPQEQADGLARRRAALARRFPSATQIDVPMRSWCWRADRTPCDGGR